MPSEKYRKYKAARESAMREASSAVAGGLTAGPGLFPALHQAGKVTGAMAKYKAATNITRQERLEMGKEILVDKLEVAKTRKSNGKEKFTWFCRKPMKATIPELDELIKKVNDAMTVEEAQELQKEVLVAIGLK